MDSSIYCEPLLSGSQPTLAESDNRDSSRVRGDADAINRFGGEYHCSPVSEGDLPREFRLSELVERSSAGPGGLPSSPLCETTLNNTLSLIMPVRNCESTLARQVARWLEIIPELTQKFEVLIVDDGSADHTFDIANELSREYPQIRALRNMVSRGTQQAVRTGLEQARGEIVFVQDEDASISSNDLRRLWEMRRDQQLVMARTPAKSLTLKPELLDRLTAWGEALKQQASESNQAGAIQMIRRGAIEEMRSEEAEPVVSLTATKDNSHSRTDAVHEGGMQRGVRSFLSHLRDLALGE